MARVLITGARAPVALDLMRQMSRSGHQIWLADSLAFPAAAFSRYSQGYVRAPIPRDNPRGFVAALVSMMRDKKIDMLIPTGEKIFYLARYRSDFENPDAVFCDDFALLDRLHNKYEFATSINHPDVQAPETFMLKDSLCVE